MSARSRKIEKVEIHGQKVEVPAPVYVHIDEFLAQKPELSPHDKAGFKVFMQGRRYQHSMKDFEEALKEFFNRDR